MKQIRSVNSLRKILSPLKRKGKQVGLVPTMGYFHEGHLSLMRRARRECDVVVVSLFVNPTQFGPNEDLAAYPRDLRSDSRLAKAEKVDILFTPTSNDVYKKDYQTVVTVGDLAGPLCGRARSGHFNGVATIVTKLFNMIEPDIAYFGQKDYQQARIIQQVTEDLSYNIKVRVLPTVRAKDGLALSSRNTYLNPDERFLATKIYSSLKKVRDTFKKGEKEVHRLEKLLLDELRQYFKLKQIDYAEIRDADTLVQVPAVSRRAVAAVAVKVGKARLIDNIIL